MTDQEFAKLWIGYCNANGVIGTPVIEVGNGQAVPGYVPPTNMIWRTSRGDIVQNATIIQMSTAVQSHLEIVQFAFGVPLGERVTWKDYLNPPAAPTENGVDPMVGDVFDGSRRLFYVKGGGVQEGARYRMSNGREFVAVRIAGPFTLHWQER